MHVNMCISHKCEILTEGSVCINAKLVMEELMWMKMIPFYLIIIYVFFSSFRVIWIGPSYVLDLLPLQRFSTFSAGTDFKSWATVFVASTYLFQNVITSLYTIELNYIIYFMQNQPELLNGGYIIYIFTHLK